MPERYETARQPELAFATHLRGLSNRQLHDLREHTTCPARLAYLRDETKLRVILYGRGERNTG